MVDVSQTQLLIILIQKQHVFMIIMERNAFGMKDYVNKKYVIMHLLHSILKNFAKNFYHLVF